MFILPPLSTVAAPQSGPCCQALDSAGGEVVPLSPGAGMRGEGFTAAGLFWLSSSLPPAQSPAAGSRCCGAAPLGRSGPSAAEPEPGWSRAGRSDCPRPWGCPSRSCPGAELLRGAAASCCAEIAPHMQISALPSGIPAPELLPPAPALAALVCMRGWSREAAAQGAAACPALSPRSTDSFTPRGAGGFHLHLRGDAPCN